MLEINRFHSRQRRGFGTQPARPEMHRNKAAFQRERRLFGEKSPSGPIRTTYSGISPAGSDCL